MKAVIINSDARAAGLDRCSLPFGGCSASFFSFSEVIIFIVLFTLNLRSNLHWRLFSSSRIHRLGCYCVNSRQVWCFSVHSDFSFCCFCFITDPTGDMMATALISASVNV